MSWGTSFQNFLRRRVHDASMESQVNLIIHVGLPKTGTTTLQVSLRGTDEVIYVHSDGYDQPQSRAFANAVGVGRDELGEQDKATWRETFIVSMQGAALPVVVSDETLSQVSRINWDIFEDVLKRIDGEIRFVLVLRPFFSWLESLVNQFAKKGRLGILSFDPDLDDRLNNYNIDFEQIHERYTTLAERLGNRCRVEVLRYSRQINQDICALARISPQCLDNVAPLNRSLNAIEALESFLELNDLPTDGIANLPADMRCLDCTDIDRLHARHGPWMRRLAQKLGWPLEAINDYHMFRATASSVSLLTVARSMVPKIHYLENGSRIKVLTMAEDVSEVIQNPAAKKQKIKGDIARALLRVELKAGRESRLPEEEFKAAWGERREEFLEKAGLFRQAMNRKGYELMALSTDEAEAESEAGDEA